MNKLRKALPILALIAVAIAAFTDYRHNGKPIPVHAQAPSSNCTGSFTFTASGALASQTNSSTVTATPCAIFGVTYSATGTLSASIQFETSPDNTTWTAVPNTLCTPGSTSVQPPCVIVGANPMPTASSGSERVYTYQPFWRMNVLSTSGTGTGSIKAQLAPREQPAPPARREHPEVPEAQ